ncbi:putative Serine hydrolase FSH domain-containing protein [Seiridium cardinale]
MAHSRHRRLTKEIQFKAETAPLMPPDLMHSAVQESAIMGGGREVGLPTEVISSHVLPCGPLTRSTPPINDTNPELNEWLETGPTILIVLGQLALWSEARAAELAKDLRILLEHGVSVGGRMRQRQVLWKLRRDGSYSLGQGSPVHSIIGKEVDCDQVRITEWISPEPIDILEHPNVICYVNHGGAGAFNDAVCSGVSQIPIPLRHDTFDFARLVEYLGIGRVGAQKSKD